MKFERNSTNAHVTASGHETLVKSPLNTTGRNLVYVCAAAILSGCAVPFPVYTVSSSNIMSIRGSKNVVELGDVSGSQSSVSCRLQPISPEGGRTFAQYIRSAFNDEIVIAGQGPAPRGAKINILVKKVDVDCAVGTGSWTFEVEVTIGKQPPFSIRTERTFDGNVLGRVVATRAYQAFVPSVQQLIADIMAHPTSRAELGG